VGTEHRGPLCDSWASCSRNFATFVTFTHFSANRKLDYILIEQDRFILHEHDHIFIIPIYRGRLEVTGQLTWDRPCSSPGGVNISHWSGKRYIDAVAFRAHVAWNLVYTVHYRADNKFAVLQLEQMRFCRQCKETDCTGSFPHPLRGGLIPPTFAQHPRLQGERREEGKGREGERRRERRREGKVDTPMFQILKNTLSVTVYQFLFIPVL